jgi:hypothetical protein
VELQGYNSGKVYAFRCENEEDRDRCIEMIQEAAARATEKYFEENSTKIERWQVRAREKFDLAEGPCTYVVQN